MQIKQLVWTQLPDYEEPVYKGTEVVGRETIPGWHYAKAPATGKEYKIHFERAGEDAPIGLFFPLWDCGPGYELLEDAKAQAQADFENDLLEALDL